MWTEFVEEVACFLRDDELLDDDDVVDAVLGLIKYGVRAKLNLQQIHGNFRDGLEAEGVQAAICDKLYEKYVAPTIQGE